jgi:thymidylate synthase
LCYIKAPNIQEAHKLILKHILHPEEFLDSEGGIDVNDVWDEEGNKTREVHNILVTIENPLDEEHMICQTYTKEELELYAECHLNEKRAKDDGFIPGQRLYDFFGLNQYEEVKKLLIDNKNTRRASIICCNPLLDWNIPLIGWNVTPENVIKAFEEKRPPCLLLLDFKIRNEKLHLTSILRSNDMYRTWPANVYALAKLLEKMSNDINIKPGHLDILSISAHIYEDDLEKAERALEEHP